MSETDGTTEGSSTSSTAGSSTAARIQADQVALILGAINQSQAEMHREMCESQEEAAAAKMEALRREKPLQFNKKTHEVQHSFNQSVEDRFKSAQSSLAKAVQLMADGPAKEAIVRAQQDITKGKNNSPTNRS